jgi:hypothetical protein
MYGHASSPARRGGGSSALARTGSASRPRARARDGGEPPRRGQRGTRPALQGVRRPLCSEFSARSSESSSNSRLIRSEQSAISRMIRGCGFTYRPLSSRRGRALWRSLLVDRRPVYQVGPFAAARTLITRLARQPCESPSNRSRRGRVLAPASIGGVFMQTVGLFVLHR